MNAKQLTAAETIVMKCIWDADHEMSLAEIVKNANEGYGKEWKPQTVSTYLAKLCLKNYIQMKRAGRTITYEILITEEDYKSEQAREFVRSSSLSPLFIRMNRLPKTRLRNFGMLLRNWKSSFRVKEVYSS